MNRKRRYYVVERGTRKPGGWVSWCVEVQASDWFYAAEVCTRLQRAGHLFRRREIETTRAIPTTPEECAWHAARLKASDQPKGLHHARDRVRP